MIEFHHYPKEGNKWQEIDKSLIPYKTDKFTHYYEKTVWGPHRCETRTQQNILCTKINRNQKKS